MKNIFVSGSLAYDRIMDFPGKFSDYILPEKLHILNVCFTVSGMVEKYGGTAGNVAYSLALLDEKPVILASIGKDYDRYFDWLKEHHISFEHVQIVQSEFTAGAYITTDKSDNQITGFNPGAMKFPTAYDFDGSSPGDTLVLIAPGNLQDMVGYARKCREKKIRYICDPGQSLTQWTGEDLREWISGSHMLISNDYELEMIMKITGLSKDDLLRMTGSLITTLGEKGSLISTRDAETVVPAAQPGEVVDPTGAGDAYRSGLIKGLVSGRNMLTAAKMGAVAAAYAIEHYGTQEHCYTYDAFLRRYQENFGEII
ncbi:MAG: carbohydrate kinase family protein [Nitrospirae bacterium]|nr:MAG: carbohydrate kinase family protein [Nitrospirota bacterium]